MRYLVYAVIVAMSLACSTHIKNSDEQALPHILLIDRDGNFVPVDDVSDIDTKAGERRLEQLLEGQCDVPDPYAEYLDRVKVNLSDYFDHGGDEVILYVHGGLNTLNSSIGRAVDQYREVLASDAQGKPGPYPIFVNWRSGAFTAYFARLFRIRQGNTSDTAVYTSPFYLANDLLQGVAAGVSGKAYLVQGEHSYRSTLRRDDSYLKIAAERDADVLYTGNGSGGSFTRKAVWLLTSPFKLLTTPFAHTLPRPAWDVMTRRAKALVHKPSELDFDMANACGVPEKTWSGSGALTRFVSDVDAFIQAQKIRRGKIDGPRLTLIGHSMGAIVSNHLLRAVPDVHFSDIVYMAGAASTRDTADALGHYMTRGGNLSTQFYSLSLQPENEDRERSAFGLLPSGSLLVWIDEMYTSPDTVLDRTVGRWDNIKYARYRFEPGIRDRLHFKVFDFDPAYSPQAHGQFDELRFRWWDRRHWWE